MPQSGQTFFYILDQYLAGLIEDSLLSYSEYDAHSVVDRERSGDYRFLTCHGRTANG
jgi:hypothetical protein